MGRPRKTRRSNSSLLKRVDDSFVDLFEELQDQGEIQTFPEFTRRVVRELKETDMKKHIKFPGFFK